MPDFTNMSIAQMLDPAGFDCHCGRRHDSIVREVLIGPGAIEKTPEMVARFGGGHPLIVADKNTFAAAGERLCGVLRADGMEYGLYVYPQEQLEPDEHAVGQPIMTFDPKCDFIIALGSGTINDICKILSVATKLPYLVVGTAPSMDGYASNSSSMILGGIKTSIYATCPKAIIADTDIVKNAPMRMLQAGVGDIAAKYVSVCEWRLSHIINGEYYCEDIAALVRQSVKKCVDGAPGLLSRDPGAVEAVIEGLILSGIAMSYATYSRPASGLEHYFSHIWDMRALESGTACDLHGIQVGIGTVLTLRLYDRIRKVIPDREKALAKAKTFDRAAWEEDMRRVFGRSAPGIIKIEDEVGKNDPDRLPPRLDRIIAHWDEILKVIDEELPSAEELENLLKGIGAPTEPRQIGLSDGEVRDALTASKEIRDKYIASRLLWDLGLLDEMADALVATL